MGSPVDDLVTSVEAMFSGPPDVPPVTRESVSLAFAAKILEAVTYREQTGIQAVWRYADDAYNGVDEANQHTFRSSQWVKSMSLQGPVQTNDRTGEEDDNRSSLYPRLTARYTDVAAAQASEILIAVDEELFSFEPTPIPDLIKGQNDLTTLMSSTVPGAPLERDARPHEISAMTGVLHGQVPTPRPAVWPPRVPLTTKDLVEEQLNLAKDKAQRAQRRIQDWTVECHYSAHMRRVIFDTAKYGVGIIKGPFPDKVRRKALSWIKGGMRPDGTRERDRAVLQIQETIKPAAKRISPWNLFPDPACGERVSDGNYIVERDFLSAKQVRALKDLDGYDTALLDRVLAEGPSKLRVGGEAPHEDGDTQRYEIFYVYGTLTREELRVVNPDALAGVDEAQETVHVIATMINNHAVYVTVHPLDSGEFPYHPVPWIQREGYWAGIGVAEQLLAPQRLLSGATRALADNAGLSSGIQLLLEEAGIYPADGHWTITPNKVWLQTNRSKHDDARKCLAPVIIPNTTGALMQVITYALQLAEESTNIPLVTQGRSGATMPDTYGATQLQNNNANQLLRRIATTFDDMVTEPIVRQLYEWLLLDPDVPDDEKGDFVINAHGSSALVERAIQEQTIQQMSELVSKAAALFGVDPKKWFKEWLKSRRLDYRKFMLSDEEQQKLAQTPPPPPPQVQVAQVKAAADAQQKDLDRQFHLQIAKLDAQMEERKLQLQERQEQLVAAHDQASAQADLERARTENAARLQALADQRELAILTYSQKRGISLDEIKAELAQTVMKLRTQEKLAAMPVPKAAPQVATPPTEPPGRAPNGEAFQR